MKIFGKNVFEIFEIFKPISMEYFVEKLKASFGPENGPENIGRGPFIQRQILVCLENYF